MLHQSVVIANENVAGGIHIMETGKDISVIIPR
jgi:hypothetical protein